VKMCSPSASLPRHASFSARLGRLRLLHARRPRPSRAASASPWVRVPTARRLLARARARASRGHIARRAGAPGAVGVLGGALRRVRTRWVRGAAAFLAPRGALQPSDRAASRRPTFRGAPPLDSGQHVERNVRR
jgi:hypothetical protein